MNERKIQDKLDEIDFSIWILVFLNLLNIGFSLTALTMILNTLKAIN